MISKSPNSDAHARESCFVSLGLYRQVVCGFTADFASSLGLPRVDDEDVQQFPSRACSLLPTWRANAFLTLHPRGRCEIEKPSKNFQYLRNLRAKGCYLRSRISQSEQQQWSLCFCLKLTKLDHNTQ